MVLIIWQWTEVSWVRRVLRAQGQSQLFYAATKHNERKHKCTNAHLIHSQFMSHVQNQCSIWSQLFQFRHNNILKPPDIHTYRYYQQVQQLPHLVCTNYKPALNWKIFKKTTTTKTHHYRYRYIMDTNNKGLMSIFFCTVLSYMVAT